MFVLVFVVVVVVVWFFCFVFWVFLGVVLRPTREFFIYVETSQLPEKGYKC